MMMMVLSCLPAALAAEKGSSNVTLTVEGDTGSGSGGSGGHGGSGGGGGGSSAPKKHTTPSPVGDKAGGVDGKGNAYHLNAGIHVNENVRETGYMHDF